jgi:hypothetical protein
MARYVVKSCQLYPHLGANFLELRQREVRRILLPRTPVNRLHSCLFRALIKIAQQNH